MQYFRKESWTITAIALILAVVSWGIGLYSFLPSANASLANISDTLSTSIPGVAATHTIAYTNTSSTVPVGLTIAIIFPAQFGNVASTTVASMASSTGINVLASCAAGLNNVALSTSTPGQITLTACASGVASGTKSIVIANTITNPTSTGSYVITVGGTQSQTADTRVAIVNGVNVTASVNTSLTFTVTGMSTGTSIGAATTTGTSSSTFLNFGTLNPGSSSAQILGQTLAVTTNARNGYTVTVQQNQNLLSSNGAQINVFKDNNATTTPSPWVSPAGTLDATNTYGHYGFTSDSLEANAGTGLFSNTSTLYVGNMANPVPIMKHTGPADGTATSSGRTEVAVKIEITALQPAGNDYANTLWYVATPVF